MPIADHSYDESTRVFKVQFKDGGPIYLYQDVPPDQAVNVTTAEPDALGKAIRDTLVIGNPYLFNKVDPADTPDGQGTDL